MALATGALYLAAWWLARFTPPPRRLANLIRPGKVTRLRYWRLRWAPPGNAASKAARLGILIELEDAVLQVAIYLFDGITALDAVGPFESLSRSKEVAVTFVGRKVGPVRTGNRALALLVDKCIDEITEADVLIIPGGGSPGLGESISDPSLLEWIRAIDATTKVTCSVCTGALILGATRLLSGRQASTHWRAKGALAQYGAAYSPDRLTRDGKYLSSAGVSAGIDLGLRLCGELLGKETGEAIELSMQYDPEPPFGTGNPGLHATSERVRTIEEFLR